MGPGSDPAGVDDDGQRLAVGVIGDGGSSPRRAIAGTGRADVDPDKPVRPPAGRLSCLVSAIGSLATRPPCTPIRITRRLPRGSWPVKLLCRVLWAWPTLLAVSVPNQMVRDLPGITRLTLCREPG